MTWAYRAAPRLQGNAADVHFQPRIDPARGPYMLLIDDGLYLPKKSQPRRNPRVFPANPNAACQTAHQNKTLSVALAMCWAPSAFLAHGSSMFEGSSSFRRGIEPRTARPTRSSPARTLRATGSEAADELNSVGFRGEARRNARAPGGRTAWERTLPACPGLEPRTALAYGVLSCENLKNDWPGGG